MDGLRLVEKWASTSASLMGEVSDSVLVSASDLVTAFLMGEVTAFLMGEVSNSVLVSVSDLATVCEWASVSDHELASTLDSASAEVSDCESASALVPTFHDLGYSTHNAQQTP